MRGRGGGKVEGQEAERGDGGMAAHPWVRGGGVKVPLDPTVFKCVRSFCNHSELRRAGLRVSGRAGGDGRRKKGIDMSVTSSPGSGEDPDGG